MYPKVITMEEQSGDTTKIWEEWEKTGLTRKA